MLSAVGSSGISSTIGRHPGLIRAEPILTRINRSVQARGHWFNTDWSLKLLPTVEGEFVLPQNTLKADTSVKSDPYVRRGRVMYDPKTHTSVLTVPFMLLDVVVELDYNDLPVAAVDLIQARAIWELVQNADADQIGLNARKIEVNRAVMAFEVERLSQADYSLRDNPQYARIMGGLKPRYSQRSPNGIGGN
jgi:hypothetical protein